MITYEIPLYNHPVPRELQSLSNSNHPTIKHKKQLLPPLNEENKKKGGTRKEKERKREKREKKLYKKILDQGFVSRSNDAPFVSIVLETLEGKEKFSIAHRSPQNSKQLFQESL